MARGKKRAVGRREFLKGVAAGAGALAAVDTLAAKAAAPAAPARAFPLPAVEGDPLPTTGEVLTVDRTGSDFMVDVFKSLNLEYVSAVAGSSFRGLHEIGGQLRRQQESRVHFVNILSGQRPGAPI
jgi:acetolactate synthase I/II/III large subunit